MKMLLETNEPSSEDGRGPELPGASIPFGTDLCQKDLTKPHRSQPRISFPRVLILVTGVNFQC